jgi:exonuclease VII small subunit
MLFFLALSSPVSAGINKDEAAVAQEKTGGAPQTNQEYSEQERKEYEKTAKKKVAEFDKKIRELEVHAVETGLKARDEAKTGYKKGMKELKEKQTVLKKEVKKLAKEGRKTWESARKKVDGAVDELQKAYDRVRATFTSEKNGTDK